MATGPTYVIQYRRKRKGVTDYKKRLNILKSKKDRLVVRSSNKHTLVQLIRYNPDGDMVIASAHSSELKKFGWNHNTSNTPTAYLTGLLGGLRAKSKDIRTAILDNGLLTSVKGNGIYSALKGAVDSGLEIQHDESVFPTESRIRGEHIVNYTKKDIATDFDKIKKVILDKFNK